MLDHPHNLFKVNSHLYIVDSHPTAQNHIHISM
jgi:hypothetical protein